MPLASILAQAKPQQFECTNCGDDTTALIGILLAAAALVVSFASLYVTALRRPAIDVEPIRHDSELLFPGWSGPMPTRVDGWLWLQVTNTGASGTVIDKLQVSDKFEVEGGERPWNRRQHAGNSLRTKHATVALPLVFERGDSCGPRPSSR